MNTSNERNSFQINKILEKVAQGKKTKEDAEDYIDFIKSHQQYKLDMESTDEWKIDNLEYDLRSTQWICDKAKASDSYAQNLYAAMCNNEFTKNDVWPILSDKRWSCSWRYAGGIIADMRENGDYIDWYCSGIRGDTAEPFNPTPEQIELIKITDKYVSESVVTDEIKDDLLKLGWVVVTEN